MQSCSPSPEAAKARKKITGPQHFAGLAFFFAGLGISGAGLGRIIWVAFDIVSSILKVLEGWELGNKALYRKYRAYKKS